MADRTASVQRTTDETDVTVTVDIDGNGHFEGSTGIGFLDHMLAQIAKHGMFDLDVNATGDLNVDGHHTAEDVGITRARRATTPLAIASVSPAWPTPPCPWTRRWPTWPWTWPGATICRSTRSFQQDAIGDLESSLIEHFIGSFARHLGAAVHVRLLAGRDDHHKAEAIFKALARALDAATALDPRREGQVPSTKGTLET